MNKFMFFKTPHTYLKSFSSLWTKIVTLTVVSTCIYFCLWPFSTAMHKSTYKSLGTLVNNIDKVQVWMESAAFTEHLTCAWRWFKFFNVLTHVILGTTLWVRLVLLYRQWNKGSKGLHIVPQGCTSDEDWIQTLIKWRVYALYHAISQSDHNGVYSQVW